MLTLQEEAQLRSSRKILASRTHLPTGLCLLSSTGKHSHTEVWTVLYYSKMKVGKFMSLHFHLQNHEDLRLFLQVSCESETSGEAY